MTNEQVARMIHDLYEKVNEACERLARLEEQVKALPPMVTQPCPYLREHLSEAKEHADDWRKALINGAIRIALAILLFAAGYIWTKESSGCQPTATPAKTAAPSSNSSTP